MENKNETNEHKPGGIGIPGEVAYNYCLTQTEKLLFGFLQNLSRTKNGYWGSNAYLGKIVGDYGKQIISNSLQKLEALGYITMIYKKIKGKITRRKIYIDPKYKVKYQELITLFYSVMDDADEEEPIKKLLGYINSIIPPVYRSYHNKTTYKTTLNNEEELRSSSMTDSLRSSVGKIKRVKRISIKDLSTGIENEQKTYLIHKNKKQIKVKNVVMSDNARDVIEHWNNSPGLRKLKYNTRLHQRTVYSLNRLMKGTFFSEVVFGKDEDLKKYVGRRFSPEKINKAISNFSLVIDDAHYSPKESVRRWYKKHSLNSFLFDRREFTSNKGISLCIQMLENKPKPFHIPSVPLPDNYPTQTRALKNSYVKNVLGGVNGNMSEKDINSFKIGSEKLNNFYKANSRKIFNVIGGINDMPKLLFKAIEKECENRNSPIRPFRFSSDYSFTHTLPAYLRDQGIIYSDAEINDGDIKVQTGDDY